MLMAHDSMSFYSMADAKLVPTNHPGTLDTGLQAILSCFRLLHTGLQAIQAPGRRCQKTMQQAQTRKHLQASNKAAVPTHPPAAAAVDAAVWPSCKKSFTLPDTPAGIMYSLLNVAFHVSALVSMRTERTT